MPFKPYRIVMLLLLLCFSCSVRGEEPVWEIYYRDQPLYRASYALLVAVDDSPSAHECANSIQWMQALLTQREWGFQSEHVSVLQQQQATREHIVQEFQRLAKKVTSEDRVIVDLCLHGKEQGKDHASFVAWNEGKAVTQDSACLLPMQVALRLFAAIPCKHKLLIADACFSGALKTEITLPVGTTKLADFTGQKSASVWVSSAPSRIAFLDGGGKTFFHKTLQAVWEAYQADPNKSYDTPLLLRDLEHRVSSATDRFAFGGLNGSLTQMTLALPSKRSVQVEGQVSYQQYDPALVRAAVKELRDLLARPGLSEESRARLEKELGAVLLDRTELDRRLEDVQEGLTHLTSALAYFETHARGEAKQAYLQMAADINNDLGVAYADLPIGDKSENFKQAIRCYSEALKVFTLETFPYDWANTQNNLGTAYRNLPTGDKSENLKNAIRFYTKALKVYTMETFPYGWAWTQNNLGAAYSDLPTGDKSENIKQTIRCYSEALKVFTLEKFPSNWADTQYNMGLIYRDLGRKPEAVQSFQNALRGYEAVQDTAGVKESQQMIQELVGKQP